MARLVVGGTPDTVATAATDETLTAQSSTSVRYALVVPRQQCIVWDSPVGGTQLTDLLLDADGSTLPNGVVTADDFGAIPAFRLPNGLVTDGVWIDPVDNSSTRFYAGVRVTTAYLSAVFPGGSTSYDGGVDY